MDPEFYFSIHFTKICSPSKNSHLFQECFGPIIPSECARLWTYFMLFLAFEGTKLSMRSFWWWSTLVQVDWRKMTSYLLLRSMGLTCNTFWDEKFLVLDWLKHFQFMNIIRVHSMLAFPLTLMNVRKDLCVMLDISYYH